MPAGRGRPKAHLRRGGVPASRQLDANGRSRSGETSLGRIPPRNQSRPVGVVEGVGTAACLFFTSSQESPMQSYEVKFRSNGITSITTVVASDSSQARRLVIVQYGPGTVVLSTQRV